MFKIIKKEKTSNIIWDSNKNRPLCKFVNGVCETKDKSIAEKMKKMGYKVIDEAETKAEQ